LIKNCCPLEKNLEPFAVIGAIALTDVRAKLASAKSGSKCMVGSFQIDNISHRKNSNNRALTDKKRIYQSMLMIEKRRKVNATLEKTFIQSPPSAPSVPMLRSTEPHSR
jgi:hypothetical protein